MTHFYGAGELFHVLRPKNAIKLLTQSAEKWICMSKWAFKIFAEVILKNGKTSGDWSFFTQYVRCLSPGVKSFHQESSSKSKETNHVLLAIFSIFAKMTKYNSAVNTRF